MTSFSMTGQLNPATGLLDSNYRQPPSESVWPSDNALPQIFPMRKMTAIDDAPADAYHKNSLPSVPWAYPYLVMLGSSPRFWVLRKGAPGMVMQNGTFDENGKWLLGSGGVLRWDNPVAGTYEIIVDVFDQFGSATWRHSHTCGDASRHIIVSPNGSGAGDGSSAGNAMSWANAYLGDTVLSPTQGKVLHLIGGDYPAPIYQIFPQYHSRNIVHYAADNPANGSPVFRCRFNDQGSYRFISGIEFNDMDWTANGILQTNVNADYLVSWRNRFINIRLASGTSENESCHVSMGTTYFRKGYVAYGNYYKDVEIAMTDMFSLEEFLNAQETIVHTNPAYTTRAGIPCCFAKSGVMYAEISGILFDNPAVSGGSQGIICLQNSVTQGQFSRGFAEYNFIRCNGGSALRSNISSGAPADAINWVRRNDVIGGLVDAKNFSSGRFTYFDSNAIQNSNSANLGLTSDSGAYSADRHECVGSNGVFDSAGNLTGAFISYLYTRGSVRGIA